MKRQTKVVNVINCAASKFNRNVDLSHSLQNVEIVMVTVELSVALFSC